ncbi:MAG: ATP synthase gamma chain, sodium ion specific [candidate division WS2 bacterium ADurb.Bin280]|uniref:ATP synthase gamma chain, sodium ion specific n=1 Tax=candidate division WS2 bacterium ADurb.Bin280 TaxID=1852829 RepID=A0A1V5SBV2_9BACT|nr:MAG: ATP synthase gamma chain, sodium ion specific [candidate division WS2 bacterium ADurb.Bin280]
MAKGREIKRRIKSIGSMLQVTKAMELTSSIKMKKSQTLALRSKSYVFESWRSLARIVLSTKEKGILFSGHNKGKILVLVITSDRGLAGSYNHDILKTVIKFTNKYKIDNIDFVTMGSKGRRFVEKIGGNIIADFPLAQQVRFTATSPISLIAWEGFTKRKYRKFFSIHTHFDSPSKKGATTLKILPFDLKKAVSQINEEELKANEFKFEPDKKILIEQIAKQILRALTYQVVLESEAAEHASRMIAMKNASDAAKELKEDFEFTYDQLRQQSITAELTEISAGVNAMQ